jgi:hypothetical protein
MNESNDYKAAILKLKNRGVLKAIAAHVTENYDGVLYIIFKKRYEAEEDTIQFLLETKRNVDLFQLSEIASFIQESIDYDGEIAVRSKNWVAPDYAAEMEKRILSYTENNFEKLQKNLKTNEANSQSSHLPSYFFAGASTEEVLQTFGDTVLEDAYRFMELAAKRDPNNIEKLVKKAKELGSFTDKLVK